MADRRIVPFRLADESGEHGSLVLVLAYCGLRCGEAAALRVRDVEFRRRRLTVSQNAVQLASITPSARPRAAKRAGYRFIFDSCDEGAAERLDWRSRRSSAR